MSWRFTIIHATTISVLVSSWHTRDCVLLDMNYKHMTHGSKKLDVSFHRSIDSFTTCHRSGALEGGALLDHRKFLVVPNY